VAGPRLGTPAAIAQPPAPAPAPADVPRENIAALVQGIRIQLRQGISEATVRLQPEHFGEVTIAVRLEKGMVSAQVRAEASGVCDWLAGQEESIRSNLSEHGLQLDRFVVQRDRPRERRETPQQSNRPRARQEPDAEQPRFEVAA
jgi:flagellar hook-length control protein FliK